MSNTPKSRNVQVVDEKDDYRLLMWASHELQALSDPYTCPYGWVPRAALIEYAKKVMRKEHCKQQREARHG